MALQKELRLALVCYGGVSLAVYIHGVTREIFHLTRASRLLDDGRNEKTGCEPRGSEEVWMEILQELSGETELLVIVDVVTGASAGAINAVSLCRALAYDLPLDAHRELWLQSADVSELMEPRHMARPWSKWYLYLPIRHLIKRFWPILARDAEARTKLNSFFRSKWFRPPFSGKRLAAIVLDGLDSLGSPHENTHSLIPTGQKLECMITVTDYYGYQSALPMHSGEVMETEYRHTWCFEYMRHLGGEIHSDLERKDFPSLAFAARASASYAGAFPPARLSEMDELVRERGQDWSGRKHFVERNIFRKGRTNRSEDEVFFIDGGIVNNKPFDAALNAVVDRPAHRQVDRRIVYVEPSPVSVVEPGRHGLPGFFATLGRALSVIPRHEPIRDDLKHIETTATHISYMKAAMRAAEPGVMAEVEKIVGRPWRTHRSAEAITKARQQMVAHTRVKAGLAWLPYLTLRFTHNLGELAERIQTWTNYSFDKRKVHKGLEEWARGTALWATPDAEKLEVLLATLGIDLRTRRVRFVIRAINELYIRKNTIAERAWIDNAKQALYQHLGALLARLMPEFMNEQIKNCVLAVGEQLSASAIEQLLDMLEDHFSLTEFDLQMDKLVAELSADASKDHKQALLCAYLGFLYHDVIAFPAMRQQDLAEMPDLSVNRISPNDAKDLLMADQDKHLLQGAALNKFGAFFSRKLRENDYLWGRLLAAERLFEIVSSSTSGGSAEKVCELKAKLYMAIVKEEEPHLLHSSVLIRSLKARIIRFTVRSQNQLREGNKAADTQSGAEHETFVISEPETRH